MPVTYHPFSNLFCTFLIFCVAQQGLTLEYIRYSYSYYKDARRSISAYLADLKKQGVISIALVGTGELAELTYLSMLEVDFTPAAVVDDAKAGKKFFGMTIIAATDLHARTLDKVIVAGDTPQKMLENIAKDKIIFVSDICT